MVAFGSKDKLWVSYPKARLGDSAPGWMIQAIDGSECLYTGDYASIALNQDGLGFIGYVQYEDRNCGGSGPIDYIPYLKVAMQQFTLFIPVVLR